MTFYDPDTPSPDEALARQLERSRAFRVLRQLPEPDRFWCRTMPVPTDPMTIAVLDCETTGLDPQRHRMIELAVGTITIDADRGDVVDVSAPVSWLEDPKEDLPIEIERLTHITSRMLVGQRFDDRAILAKLGRATVIVAHNASFDRSFVTRRFPGTAAMPWACSLNDVRWDELGWPAGRSVEMLLMRQGFFLPDAHRAAADVAGVMALLAMTGDGDRSIAAHLVRNAQRTNQRLFAHGAPFRCRPGLKTAGYRWSPERRAWWIEGDSERISNERIWLTQLSARIDPELAQIDWKNRYA